MSRATSTGDTTPYQWLRKLCLACQTICPAVLQQSAGHFEPLTDIFPIGRLAHLKKEASLSDILCVLNPAGQNVRHVRHISRSLPYPLNKHAVLGSGTVHYWFIKEIKVIWSNFLFSRPKMYRAALCGPVHFWPHDQVFLLYPLMYGAATPDSVIKKYNSILSSIALNCHESKGPRDTCCACEL